MGRIEQIILYFFHFLHSNCYRQCQMLHFARKLFQKYLRCCFPCRELDFSRTVSPKVTHKISSISGSLTRLRLYNNTALPWGDLLADLSFLPIPLKILLPNFILQQNQKTSLVRTYQNTPFCQRVDDAGMTGNATTAHNSPVMFW